MSTTQIGTPLVLTRGELSFLEDALQRDAVGLIQNPDLLQKTVTDVRESPAYKANRALFSKVWDLLYT